MADEAGPELRLVTREGETLFVDGPAAAIVLQFARNATIVNRFDMAKWQVDHAGGGRFVTVRKIETQLVELDQLAA